MAFTVDSLKHSNIKNILHVGADRGGELPQYAELNVDKVVWIEANPEVYNELLDNIQNMNIPNITNLTFNQLISDKDDVDTEFNIYYGPDAGYLVGNKGMSSILKADKNWWGYDCYKGSLTLKSVTIDTFLERNKLGFDFDMLNMDVQGAELMVLRGASKLIQSIRYINCEITFSDPQYENNPLYEEMKDFFEAIGFQPIHIDMAAYNWGDIIWERR